MSIEVVNGRSTVVLCDFSKSLFGYANRPEGCIPSKVFKASRLNGGDVTIGEIRYLIGRMIHDCTFREINIDVKLNFSEEVIGRVCRVNYEEKGLVELVIEWKEGFDTILGDYPLLTPSLNGYYSDPLDSDFHPTRVVGFSIFDKDLFTEDTRDRVAKGLQHAVDNQTGGSVTFTSSTISSNSYRWSFDKPDQETKEFKNVTRSVLKNIGSAWKQDLEFETLSMDEFCEKQVADFVETVMYPGITPDYPVPTPEVVSDGGEENGTES